MNYFLIRDDAFTLESWLMIPFSRTALTSNEMIFNYRIPKGRRVVENTFSILANLFRVLDTMHQHPKVATNIAPTTVVLHNFLRKHTGTAVHHNPKGNLPKPDDQLLHGEIGNKMRNPSRLAKQHQNLLTDHFVNDGAV